MPQQHTAADVNALLLQTQSYYVFFVVVGFFFSSVASFR